MHKVEIQGEEGPGVFRFFSWAADETGGVNTFGVLFFIYCIFTSKHF